MNQLALPFNAVSDTQRVRASLCYWLPRRWWSLYELQERVQIETGIYCSDATISARLRDLRKAVFGDYNVRRRKRSEKVWEYRIIPREEE